MVEIIVMVRAVGLNHKCRGWKVEGSQFMQGHD